MAPRFDQRGQSVEHPKNIFKLRYPVKPLTIVLSVAVCLVLAGLFYIIKHHYDRNWEFSSNVSKDTSAGVENFGMQVNAIKQAFVECEDIYSNGRILFSLALSQCRDNLVDKLTAAQAMRDKYASVIEVSYLDTIDTIIRQLYQDLRGVNLDLSFVQSFEEDVVRNFVQLCERKKDGLEYSREWNAKLDNSLQESLNKVSDVMSMQTTEYYILRDFVIPRLSKTKDILIIAAREAHGLESTKTLLEAKEAYANLIREQSGYNPRKSTYPFQDGFLRRMQSRDFKVTGDRNKSGEEELEERRAGDAKDRAPLMAIRGKYNAVKDLVDCGILKPEALDGLGKIKH